MGSVPDVLAQRWRSRILVGQAKHQLIVRVRRGYINRLYQPLEMLDGSRQKLPIIWKGLNLNPWQGQWTVEGPWITLTEIESAKYTKSTTSDNGSSTLTVVMDDIAFLNTEGAAGLYHTIQRGYYSPQRGIAVAGRPNLWESNSYADVLNGGYQIELWEGYGPDGDASVTPLPVAGDDGTCVPPGAAISRTWVGIIDGCDIDTHPDTITITARDFGMLLTDQRVIYRNKAPEIHSPVIFADRRIVLGEKPAAYAPSASGTKPGYTPTGVLPPNPTTGALSAGAAGGWVSDEQSSSDDIVWLEVTLPAGAYDEFYLGTEAPGQTMFVSINAAGDCRWNGVPVSPGWINDHEDHLVPGTSDVHYVNYYQAVAVGGTRFNLGGELQCSDGTVLRVSLTNLHPNTYTVQGDSVPLVGYVAHVLMLWGYRYGTTASAPVPVATGLDYGKSVKKGQGWVLIDDVADIIRMVFLWCGFKEWNVQDFGYSLEQPFNFGQDQFFIDIVTSVMNQANYIFYMEAPTDDDMSIGVPTFAPQRVFSAQPEIAASVRDNDLLNALTVKWDLSNLPYSFRVRGTVDKTGTTFGSDLAKRYSGTYFPPWSGIDYVKVSPTKRDDYNDHSERLAGLKRNYVETQGQVISLSLNNDADCLFAAVLTSVQYALGEATGQLQINGLPGIELNMAVVVIDEGSGTNSRIWVTSVESDHTMGEDGAWHMTIGGALLDTEDLNLIAEDFAYVVFKYTMRQAG